ncbi:U-box domain-containing protein [Drosera capensis]
MTMANSSTTDDLGEIERARHYHSSSMESASSRGEEVVEDTVFVAVGKEVKESNYTLIWALQNSKGKKICLIHVHEPPQTVPILGGKFPISRVGPEEAKSYLEKARHDMLNVLEEYVGICSQAGVRAEKRYIERNSIKKGIVELVSQLRIGRLVMGAAADNKFSRKMIEPRSEKAIYVRQEAPAFCHIWFVCKSRLIYTREGIKKPIPNIEAEHLPSFRSLSLAEDMSNMELHQDLGSYHKSMSNASLLSSVLDTEETSDGYEHILRNRLVIGLSPESDGASTSSPYSPNSISADGEPSLRFSPLPRSNEKHHPSSPPSVLLERSGNDEVYDQLEQAMTQAEYARREVFEESKRRRKAEKDTIDAIRKAKAAETSYSLELRRRREVEEELAMGKEELQFMRNQRDKVYEDLQNALTQKSSLENELEQSSLQIKELEEKMLSIVDLLQQYKKEQEELQVERVNALREAEELREQLENQPSSSNTRQYFATFSLLELEEATDGFNPSSKIGEGGYGSIYKGSLRHTEVAIKMPHPDTKQGYQEFYQEVDILSKLRHPNIVTLIGSCPETWTLVYEYLPNGSLEDRLACKDNTPPLSWQERLRIAAELCSVLIFLHCSEPCSIIHGDIKPANVLLDSNFRCKLSDFGISRAVSNETGDECTSKFHLTEQPKGTFAYMDPVFLATGELTAKSDIFSYGIILLRLLTGKPAKGIIKEVQYALDKDNLNVVLDPLAGDWPFVQANQLALLALRCCDVNRSNRPDLASEVWRLLESMRVSCGSSSPLRLDDDDDKFVPSYFICPIFQEVMQDPHLAADGFSYEAEALRGWLDAGHDTSPMTNLKLAHTNLVPNRALRSAIQEWQPRRH